MRACEFPSDFAILNSPIRPNSSLSACFCLVFLCLSFSGNQISSFVGRPASRLGFHPSSYTFRCTIPFPRPPLPLRCSVFFLLRSPVCAVLYFFLPSHLFLFFCFCLFCFCFFPSPSRLGVWCPRRSCVVFRSPSRAPLGRWQGTRSSRRLGVFFLRPFPAVRASCTRAALEAVAQGSAIDGTRGRNEGEFNLH